MEGIKKVCLQDLLDVEYFTSMESLKDEIIGSLKMFEFRTTVGFVRLVDIAATDRMRLATMHNIKDGKFNLVMRDEDGQRLAFARLFDDATENILSSRETLLYEAIQSFAVEKSIDGISDKDIFVDMAMKYIKFMLKPDKNGNVKTSRLINFLGAYTGEKIDQSAVKRFNTLANNLDKKLYVYLTDKHIENHYSNISQCLDMKTCMTKGVRDLSGIAHYTEYDVDADIQGRTIYKIGAEDKPYVFTANVEGYNGCDDFRLALVSELSPEELKSENKYPFIGRFIVAKGEDGEFNVFNKVYGKEYVVDSILCSSEFTQSAFDGYKVKAFISHTGTGLKNLKEVYITPYIDGEYNVFRVGEDVLTDELGRKYRWATIQPHHKHNYEYWDVSGEESAGLYWLNQKTWVSEEAPWRRFNQQCQFTGDSLGMHNGAYCNVNKCFVRIDYVGKTLDLASDILKLREQLKELTSKMNVLRADNIALSQYKERLLELTGGVDDVWVMDGEIREYEKSRGISIEHSVANILPMLYARLECSITPLSPATELSCYIMLKTFADEVTHHLEFFELRGEEYVKHFTSTHKNIFDVAGDLIDRSPGGYELYIVINHIQMALTALYILYTSTDEVPSDYYEIVENITSKYKI